jgi:hypothetical protein
LCWKRGRPSTGRHRPTGPTTSASLMSTSAEEQLTAGPVIVPGVDVAEQEVLVDSYRTAYEIRQDRWWYIQYQMDLQAT